MCMICERIRAIKNGTNPYFVQELETGYVVLGDHQHFKGYTLFLCKQHAAELFCLERAVKIKFLEEMSLAAQAVSAAFGAEKMNCSLLLSLALLASPAEALPDCLAAALPCRFSRRS